MRRWRWRGVPARVEFRASLPRNAAGKVLRRELRADATATAQAPAPST